MPPFFNLVEQNQQPCSQKREEPGNEVANSNYGFPPFSGEVAKILRNLTVLCSRPRDWLSSNMAYISVSLGERVYKLRERSLTVANLSMVFRLDSNGIYIYSEDGEIMLPDEEGCLK